MPMDRFWETENATMHQRIRMRFQMAWTAMTAKTVAVISKKDIPGTDQEEGVLFRVGTLEDVTDAVMTIAADLSQQVMAQEEARQIMEQTSMGGIDDGDN